MIPLDKNLSIKLPDQFYCGFLQRDEDELLGFLTPFGTDQAFEKRKYTVDRWAKSNRNKTPIDPKVFDNELLEGYRLDRHIKRYGWNGGNVVVRVEDPRGFEAEISVANLCKLIENNTIENGLIKAKCIWGRDGAQNILLAENSQPYIVAIQNTERQKKKISLKDVVAGNEILLQNGKKGIYLGAVYPLGLSENSDNSEIRFGMESVPKRKYALIEDDYNYGKKHIVLYSELKVSEILSAETNWSEEYRREYIHSLQYGLENEIVLPWCVSGFAFEKNQFPELKFVSFDPIGHQLLLRKSVSGIILKNKQTRKYTLIQSYALDRLLKHNGIDAIRNSNAGFVELVVPNTIRKIGRTVEQNMYYSYPNTRKVFQWEDDHSMKEVFCIDDLLANFEIYTIHYSLK